MPTCLTQQADWITDCITWMLENGKNTFEASKEKQDEWVQHHDELANATLLMRTQSWYTGANIEGKPRRLLSYIGGVGTYKQICEEIAQNGYEGFVVG